MIEVLKQSEIGLANLISYQSTPNKPTIHEYGQAVRALSMVRKAIQEEALRNVQRLGQEIEQEPVSYQSTQEKSRIETVPAQGGLLPTMREGKDFTITHPPQRTEQDLSEQGRNRSAILGNNIEEMVNNGLPFLTALDTALKVYDHHTPQLHPPQRTWVGLDWLPEHKCGLHLSHNEHRDVYETIEQFYNAEDFISIEEWRKAVAEDSVWVLQWYPDTPIGSYRIAASTLEAIEAKLKEKNGFAEEKNT